MLQEYATTVKNSSGGHIVLSFQTWLLSSGEKQLNSRDKVRWKGNGDANRSGCCVMPQTRPRLINWLNPALVKAVAWIYWVWSTPGNWDLRLSELQTASVKVYSKKNLSSLFLEAIEDGHGKAIHINTATQSIATKTTDTALTFRVLIG